jgi:hypothetical protein
MIDPYKKTSGSIAFMRIDQDSKLKELKFEDGYLVSFVDCFDAEGSQPMMTSLAISARKISVGEASHDVKW